MGIKEDGFVFSTGKEIYANRGIIGLSEPGKYGWEVSEGYDGGIEIDDLTEGEKIELADYMISLWQRFRGGYKNENSKV